MHWSMLCRSDAIFAPKSILSQPYEGSKTMKSATVTVTPGTFSIRNGAGPIWAGSGGLAFWQALRRDSDGLDKPYDNGHSDQDVKKVTDRGQVGHVNALPGTPSLEEGWHDGPPKGGRGQSKPQRGL
jgi:hypothetical protein